MLPLADVSHVQHLYRVRPGFTFGMYNEKHPGDLVELTESEARGFLDKLELVVEEAPRPVQSMGIVSAQATVRPVKTPVVKRGKRG